MKKIFLILLSLAFFTACERKIDTFTVSSGTANFKKYISIGNSLVAGYADGALYTTGQKYSTPNLIAGQLQLAGSGAFVQPMVKSEYGVDFPGSAYRLVLGPSTDCKGVTSLGPVPLIGAKDPLLPNVGYAVNNFGVPGAKSFHMLAPHYGDPALLALGKANPYFCRFAQTAASSVLQDAMAASATFFTMQLGDNDVLSYALSGGMDTITSPAFFGTVMGGVLQGLTSNHAQGVIANIPDVTSIPFFTTVPYNGLVLARQSLVDSVNYAMSVFHLPFTYHLGQNPFLIPDPTSVLPFKVRQMVAGELVLLTVPQDSMKCYGMGIVRAIPPQLPYPIPKQFILTLEDIAKLKTATAAYNEIIKGLAANFKLGLVDLNTRMNELQSGIVWDGIALNAQFVTGGAFSLDGIHLNPRGCALSANFFIDAINKQYGSTIPFVDITKYPGVIFP
ncbi:MAG: hypothetical protein NTW10_09210 [Bacteroidetes bacterium]|nr:hypothetical protein [Bacteroidota bacterium]